MEASNPYQTPLHVDTGPVNTAALVELAKEWEKLRLVYNGILIVPGLVILALWVGKLEFPVPLAIFFSGCVGIGANVAFLLGPAAELYLRAFFRGGESIGAGRKLIFGGGVVFSLMVMFPAVVLPFVLAE